ncbi:MAG: hypothetical protein AAB225_06355 [Acidobacteriota bacterium]
MPSSSVARLTLILAALSLGAPAQQELTVDQIIQKHHAALGGVEKIKAIRSVKITGKAVLGGGAMEAPMTIQFKRPRLIHTELTIQGRSIVTGFDGTSAWMINPMTGSSELQKRSEEEAQETAESADFDGPLVDYKAKGHSVELAGKEDVEGTPAYKLKVTRKIGRTDYMFLDAKSFLLIKSVGRRKQMGQELDVESFTGDYKPVNGVLMAHSIESKVGGKAMMRVTFETIEANVDIDDSIFKMPAPPEKAPEKKP